MATLSKPLPEPLPFTHLHEIDYVVKGINIKTGIKTTSRALLDEATPQEIRNGLFRMFIVTLLQSMDPLTEANIDAPFVKNFRYDMRYTKAMMFSYVEIYDTLRESMKAVLYGPQRGYTIEFFELLARKFEAAYIGTLLAWKMDLARAAGGDPLRVLAHVYEQHDEEEHAKTQDQYSQQTKNDDEDDGDSLAARKSDQLTYRPLRKSVILINSRDSMPSSSNDHSNNPSNNTTSAPEVPAGMIPFNTSDLVKFDGFLDNIAAKPAQFNQGFALTAEDTTAPYPLLGKLKLVEIWANGSMTIMRVLAGKLQLCPHIWPHCRVRARDGDEGVQEKHVRWAVAVAQFLKLWRLIAEEMAEYMLKQTMIIPGLEVRPVKDECLWTDERLKELESELRSAGERLRDAAVHEWVECQRSGWRNSKKIDLQNRHVGDVNGNPGQDEDEVYDKVGESERVKGKIQEMGGLETVEEETFWDEENEENQDEQTSPTSPPESEDSQNSEDSDPILEIVETVKNGKSVYYMMKNVRDIKDVEH